MGTYRHTEVAPGLAMAELLADLRRGQRFDRVLLTGLDEAGVDALIRSIAGEGPPLSFTRAIHRDTDGNPFFIEEMLRHLADTDPIYQREGRRASHVGID